MAGRPVIKDKSKRKQRVSFSISGENLKKLLKFADKKGSLTNAIINLLNQSN